MYSMLLIQSESEVDPSPAHWMCGGTPGEKKLTSPDSDTEHNENIPPVTIFI